MREIVEREVRSLSIHMTYRLQVWCVYAYTAIRRTSQTLSPICSKQYKRTAFAFIQCYTSQTLYPICSKQYKRTSFAFIQCEHLVIHRRIEAYKTHIAHRLRAWPCRRKSHPNISVVSIIVSQPWYRQCSGLGYQW